MFQAVRNLARSTLHLIQNSSNSTPSRSAGQDGNTRRGLQHQSALEDDVVLQIQETTKQACILIREWRPLSELKDLLTGCPRVTEVLNCRDGSGYTLLQHAIIRQRSNIVQWLLTQGAELNSPICGRPLHLAAKLGHAEILKLLLDYNADPFVVSCVCYPNKHVDARTVYSSHGKRWYVTCPGDVFTQDKLMEHQFEYPLYFAIVSDSVECVKLLLLRDICQMKTSLPALHLACSSGSLKCARYFTDCNTSQVNQMDKSAWTPIQHGVKWGKSMVENLVLKGGSILTKTNHDETVLHLLFQRPKTCERLAETVSYLLDCGLKMNINALDRGGNSALNALLVSVHQQVPSRLIENGVYGSAQTALSAEEQGYFDAMCLLLNCGLNPNIANRVGDTSLHLLSRILCKPETEGMDNARSTHTSLVLVFKMLEKLLSMGANPNLVNNTEGTVLGMLVFHGTNAIISSAEFGLPDETDLHYLIESIKILKNHKCDFHSCRYFGSGCLLHNVLGHLDRLESEKWHCATETELAARYTECIMRLTQVLLESGSKPNVCRCVQTDLHTLYYKLISKWKLLPMPLITNFVLLFLRHGADPNIGGKHVPMSVFRYRSSHSYWPVYPLLHIMNLIGSQEMVDREKDLLALMHVFYNAMDENNSKQCILHYLEYDRLRSRSVKYPQFDEYLLAMLNTPASLKRLSACFIYSNLADRQVDNLGKLQLPCTLVKFIANFQYGI